MTGKGAATPPFFHASPWMLSQGSVRVHWVELALDIVRKWEGCRLRAYPDPGTGGEPWTIGYGATGSDVRPGTVWTQQQAEDRLRRDLARFGAGVEASVAVPLAAHEMAALVSLTYNIGLAAFRRSTLLKQLNAGSRTLAAQQFLRWNRAGGRVMRGLTNRRADERALFLGAR